MSMITRGCVVLACALAACTAISNDLSPLAGFGSGSGSGLDAGVFDAASGSGSDAAGSDGSIGGSCGDFDPDDTPFSQGYPIEISNDCVVAACETSECGVVTADAGIIVAFADPEIIGSVVVITKNGAPSDVSVTIVDTDKGKNVASKKVEKGAEDISLRTDKDIAGLNIVAIDGVGKKGYKITQGKPGMILLPGNKAKRYIEIEVTKDVDPNIIVP